MVRVGWQPDVTPTESDDLFMAILEDDTSEAAWMALGDLHFWSMTHFAHSLRYYGRKQGLVWYVAARLLIRFRWRKLPGRKQLAPDTFVAFVADHPRECFYADTEPGGFPPFVLEIISASSRERDEQAKRMAYDLLKVRECALFWPKEGRPRR